MSSFKIDISGLDVIKKNIEKVKVEAQTKMLDAINNFGQNTRSDAIENIRKNGSIDESHLVNSIAYDVKQNNNKIDAEVVVASDYGAYVEFGTRRFAAKYVASLPTEWKTFAAQFQGGGGGSLEEFIQRIMAWVLRKGIGAEKTKSGNVSKSTKSYDDMQQAAYAIALNILQNGIKPHPYLYPAVEKNRLELIKELESIFK